MYCILNVFGLKMDLFSDQLQRANVFTNPIHIVLSYAAFMLFNHMNIPYNRMINGISRCSLLVFIIHNNYFVKTYDRKLYYEFIYDNYSIPHNIFSGIVGASITYVISLIVAQIYLVFVKAVEKRGGER